ncbi:MgtC/SapB family protein [Ottowia thiooxydans]|uniref:MgtC/SapB family protein n=1 Tax=Ottowia thiooxydans TaxID=219182 RepID=UPI000408B2CB|nr:MgtC/SapB family protein [Ottowia thiooxydans]
MWNEIIGVLSSEFAGITDVSEITRVLTRLLLAALLGGALGYEREHKGKAAGLRTHMLVAMGAALLILAPGLGGLQIADMSRVIQGVVTGIGFLGAGAIIKRQSEKQVEGLTTAAGIWMTAAIGVACGLGRESTAVLATVLTLLILAALPRVEPAADREKQQDPK